VFPKRYVRRGRGKRRSFNQRIDSSQRADSACNDFVVRSARGGFATNGPANFRKQDRRPVNDLRHISPRPEQGVIALPAVPGESAVI
jgi:protein NRD1